MKLIQANLNQVHIEFGACGIHAYARRFNRYENNSVEKTTFVVEISLWLNFHTFGSLNDVLEIRI